MRNFVALLLVVMLFLAACASIGGAPGFTTRVLAGLGCVAAITAAGGQVAADPDLGFATATDALNAINKVATGPGLSSAMTACQETFRYLSEDFAGMKAMVEAKATAPAEPPAQRKARLSQGVKAQSAPVVVKVPLK
ncbi:MAG TPA: hypothetical protein VKA83_09315 [Methylomirabilota bacterium]|nr:hypothetical protein [Methylomirabilota bacterium]